MKKAMVRAPSPLIVSHCELTHISRQPINFDKLKQEHKFYCELLMNLGLEIQYLPNLHDCADGVFVEDCAVLLDQLAIVTRPGVTTRVNELESVREAVSENYGEFQQITSPGSLEGGDVLKIGRTLYVGVTHRTNHDGITQFQNFVKPHGYKVVPVEVNGCLHLKTAVCFLGRETILINPEWVDVANFRGFRVLTCEEEFGANALLVDDRIIYPKENVYTAAKLRAFGFELLLTPTVELSKAEAGVTCLSLISD